LSLKTKDYDIPSIVNTVETDFKAEVIASSLIEAGKDADKVHIVRRKGNLRGVSKDIDGIEIEQDYSGFDMTEYLCICTNRESIYDSLPEGIFHQPSNARKARTQEDIIREIRDQRDEEFFARSYFRPFEMAVDKMLVDVRLYEQKYNKAYSYENLTAIFKDRWEILRYLSVKQALLFIKIIPVIEDVTRSFDLTAKVMSIILDCPMDVREGKKTKFPLDTEEQTLLGTWKLGLNSVLGKSVENESLDLIITVGPVTSEQMRLFESNRNNDLILKELIHFMIPFDRRVIIKYKVSKTDSEFRLSDKTHKTYLGINTRL
jgi:hypothetical protein